MDIIWTRELILEHIRLCQEALAGGLLRKSYTIGQHSFTSQDFPHVHKYLLYLQSELAALPENGGVRGPVFVQTVYRRGRA